MRDVSEDRYVAIEVRDRSLVIMTRKDLCDTKLGLNNEACDVKVASMAASPEL